MSTEEKGLVSASIVRPLVDYKQAVAAFNEYQDLKKRLRTEGDFVSFPTKDGVKETPTKQWRSKLTRFFGITCELISEEKEDFPDGTFVIKVRYRATAPNGMSMEGDGACSSVTKASNARNSDIYHNTRSHAHTRAKNRAVLELVGFGEVSAEEIDDEGYRSEPAQSYTPRTASKTDEPMTDAQHNKIWGLLQDKDSTEEGRAAYLATSFKGKCKVTQSGDHYVIQATKKDASFIIGELMKGAQA